MKTPAKLLQLAVVFTAFTATTCLAEDRQPPATPPASHAIAQPDPYVELFAPDTQVSPWLKEVLKLVESGADDQVVAAYIDSAGTFNLTWKQIVKLRQLNVPTPIISAMLSHDTQLSAGLLPLPLAPPAGSMLPAALRATNSLTLAKASKLEHKQRSETIVNPSPADEIWFPWLLNWSIESEEVENSQDFNSSMKFGPVRQPHPVQLTSPIRIYRSAWKPANTQIIVGFP